MINAPEPAVVPELLVSDLAASLEFWCSSCGFEVRYQRQDEGFAYLVLGRAHIMLEQAGLGRNWISGPLDPPFGRGINLQIAVDDLDGIVKNLAEAGCQLYMPLETKWYRVGEHEVGVRQFLVADPDGYLLRFQSTLGTRPLA